MSCILDTEIAKLVEIQKARKASLESLQKKYDITQISAISKQEQEADVSLSKVKSIIDDFNRLQKPKEKAACKEQIQKYEEIRNSFYWTMFPVQIASLDGINYSRDELMTYFKEVGHTRETYKKSLHPFCLSLYSSYDKACNACTKSLGIPLLNPQGHDFRIGDLSILFYYLKKKLLHLERSHACEVIESIIDDMKNLLMCLAKRMVYNDKCVAPTSKVEHKEEMQYGDKNHFQWIQFLCLEVLSFFETVDAVIEKNDCSSFLTNYTELCKLYSETFSTCETTVRQQLGMKQDKHRFAYASYKDYIKGSIIYAQLMKTAAKTYYRQKDSIKKIQEVLDLFAAFKSGKKTLHLLLLSLKAYYDIHPTIEETSAGEYEKYYSCIVVNKMTHMIKITDNDFWHIEEALNKKYQELTKKNESTDVYQFIEQQYVVDALLHKAKEQIKEDSIEIQKALQEDFQSKLNKRSKQVIDFSMSVEAALNSLLQELVVSVEAQEKELKTKWDFDENVNKMIARVKTEEDYNRALLDFLANKFTPLSPEYREFSYDYREHMEMLDNILEAKEIRVCKHIVHDHHHTYKLSSSMRKSKNNRSYSTSSQYAKLSKHI
jgi:hypothetical protein